MVSAIGDRLFYWAQDSCVVRFPQTDRFNQRRPHRAIQRRLKLGNLLDGDDASVDAALLESGRFTQETLEEFFIRYKDPHYWASVITFVATSGRKPL
jgi:hypothetical protein